MNDYINRQEALDLIESAGTWGWSESQLYDEISELTAADVRPVVYAEPVRIFNDPYTGRMFTTCSQCTGKISPKDKFCKHCGADMRGKQVQKSI